jgi:exodeoxyribonuclease VII small subunit
LEPAEPPVSPDLTLEAAIARLDEIARQLEAGELELADSLALYEEGIGLLRVCEGLLTSAEARVEQLREEGDGFRFERLPERP